MPAELPFGPLPEPDYSLPKVAGTTLKEVNEATRLFHDAARREWRSLTGALPDFKEAVFVWQPATGPKASTNACNAWAANLWKQFAAKAEEVSTLLGSLRGNACTVILRHVVKSCHTANRIEKDDDLK